MTERHTIFREPCLGCYVYQDRALSNLSRPNNVNLLVVAGFIVYKNYQNMPKFDPLYIFYPYTTKWHFRNPLYKKDIFETHYPKNSIFETPYTKNWYFRDLHIQQNGISETYYTKNWHFPDPPINQNGLLENPYK